jgi:putative flippase GtrA
MPRRDFIRILIIGAGVGLLIQPILANNLPTKDLAYLTPFVRIGIVLFFLILAPLALWIAKLLSRWWAGLYQFAQFAAVGTLNSFIDVGVFNLETFFYGSSIVSNGLFAAFKAFSFLCGTTNSFIWNKYWTFGSGEKTNAKEVSRFYGVAIVGWIANVGVATLVKSLGPADSHVWVNIVAPLAGIAVSFAWNFLGYKYWVFKDRK